VTVVKATNILDVETFSKSDPFCIVNFCGESPKTKTLQDTLNPEWNESFTFVRHDNPKNEVITFVLEDHNDGAADVSLGECSEKMEVIMDAGTLNKTYDIHCKDTKDHGQLTVKFEWHAEASGSSMAPAASTKGQFGPGTLSVVVKEAKDLIDGDTLSKSDAYVIIKIGQENPKTKTVDDNNNPVWDETFSFKRKSPREDLIEFFVHDLDDDTHQDFDLGSCKVKLSDIIDAPGGSTDTGHDLGKKTGKLYLKLTWTPDDASIGGTTNSLSSDKKVEIPASAGDKNKPNTAQAKPRAGTDTVTKTKETGNQRGEKAASQAVAGDDKDKRLEAFAMLDHKQVPNSLKPVLGADIAQEFKANKITGAMLVQWYTSGEMNDFKTFSKRHPTLFLDKKQLNNLLKHMESI